MSISVRGAAAGAALVSMAAPVAAQQQQVMMIETGNDVARPVAQDASSDDSPEEIAKDAARDLKDSRFYNKPGATRAQFNADWQQCRLIARGSRTPTGMMPYTYDPSVVSPLAAGIGAGLGAALAGAIIEGKQRRDNRRTCLLIRGWRLVEADAARVAAMTDADRSAYFDTIVGAATVKGKVTQRTRFSLAPDPALDLAAPLTQPGTVWLGKKVDPARPFTLAPGEGAIVLAYRRVVPAAAGHSASVAFQRYDLARRDALFQPRDWKKRGDRTTYSVVAPSHDKKAAYEVQVLRVTPGDYVINATAINNQPFATTYCFGAPVFSVAAGQVVYVGDFSPYTNARLGNGEKLSALVYTAHPDDARRTLAIAQPNLAATMVPAQLRNQASYACAGQLMDRWDIDGLPSLPPVAATR